VPTCTKSLDLDQMIALVGQGLSRDGEQLLEATAFEEGNAACKVTCCTVERS